MSKFKYNSFEEFVEAVELMGLERAWGSRFRGTGRTTKIVVDASRKVIASHLKGEPYDQVVFRAGTLKQAGRIRDLFVRITPKEFISAYCCSVNPLVSPPIYNNILIIEDHKEY